MACQSLKPSEADEFRADIARILKQARPSKPNISKEEWKAIKELRTDKDYLVLTADKGVALVVIDKKDYTKKMNQLLEDKNTYRLLKMDPTNKQKNRLINILRRIKSEGRLEESTYKKMYPTGTSSPKLYGLPKIHKKEIPLRPIVSSQGSVSYGVAKELARILKPLSGNNNHQVLNPREFSDEIKKIKLEEGECIMSYDVAALFTSIPVKSAIEVIKKKLEQDTEHHQRTTMSTQNILDLLEFCLCNTYFLFQGQYYEQTQGAAMGSPMSPVLANLYMEAFEDRALSTAGNPPRWWKRFVDDTFVILKKTTKKSSCNI